jgi:nitrite reductase/ring-hydroxylating ferredoxin subunit
MTEALAGNRVLTAILERGTYLSLSRFEGQEELLAKTHALLREGVELLQGSAARRIVEQRGFGVLHEVLAADQIGPLRDHVMPQVRPDLLALACRIGRGLLGIEGDFFVDDYTILRVNFPYLAALKAPLNAENPGIGRVDAKTREQSRVARVVDPVYDPKGYHNNEPPPAWAHGPHQDTWTGHSRYGVNLWWALDEVPEECSMVFYPETFGRAFQADPRSLYLSAGYPLPKPRKMALQRGEMLVFNPEMLHGTHLNTSNVTRLALSTRLNPYRPTFDSNCFYAREFWQSSHDIEAGRFDQVVRFVRSENLNRAPVGTLAEQTVEPDVINVPAAEGLWQAICPSERIAAGGKLLLRCQGCDDVLLLRGHQKLHAVQAHCPHLKISLADGYHDDRAIWCPAHAVDFSLSTGRSSCAALSLRTYDVEERDGTIRVRIGAKDGDAIRAG